MRYRPSGLALLLLFVAFSSPLLAAQTKGTEGYVDAGSGVRLYYRLVGSGRDTLVIVHGGPGMSFEYFGHELDPLASRGHALLFYDQRGAGRSTLVHDSAGLQASRFADDLEAVRRHFKLKSLNTLSHSWGPAVVALYATGHPERLGRTVLLDGIPLRRSELAEAFQQLDASRDTPRGGRSGDAGQSRRPRGVPGIQCHLVPSVLHRTRRPGEPPPGSLFRKRRGAAQQRGERATYTSPHWAPTTGAEPWPRSRRRPW